MKNSSVALPLILFAAAGSTISIVYSNALFLSSYPSTWLAAFLVTQAVFNTVTGIVLTPFLINNVKRNSVVLFLMSIIVTWICYFLAGSTFFLMSFIIAIIIGIISSLVTVIGWNLIPLAFGLREYKQIVVYVSQSATIGAILGSLMIPLFLKYYTLNFLLIPLSIVIFFSVIATYLLPIIQDSATKKTVKESPMKFALYKYFLIFFIGLIAAQAFIDYSFKYELAQRFSREQIAVFMGYFGGFTAILGFLTSFTISRRFLESFRIEGLLYATPIFMLVSATLVVFSPLLWTVCILASSRALFFYNHTRLGTEIVLNILPSSVRTACKSQLKSIVTSLTTVAIFLFVLAISGFVTTRGIAILVFMSSLVSFFLVKKITAAYKDTLLQESEFKRFNIIDEINPANADTFKEMIARALNSTEESVILFGLSSLKKLELIKLPDEIFQHLKHPNPLIRQSIITIIRENKDVDSVKYLLDQFKSEVDLEIKFNLLNTIAFLDKDSALSITKQYINDPLNSIYPAAIGVYLNFPDMDKYAHAISELRKLVHHSNAIVRKEVANLIGIYQLKELESDLGSLILDTNDEVSEAAIKAAASASMVSLSKQIIQQLLPGRLAYAARTALVKFGPPTIPFLLANSEKDFLIYKVLGEIPGKESEEALLKLATTDSAYLQTLIAKEASYRACHLPISDEFKTKSKDLALVDANNILYLNSIIKKYDQSYIIAEINSRIKLAKQRALLWIAIATNPIEIRKLIPSLLSSTTSQGYQQAREKALELLELDIKDTIAKKCIINIFEPQEEITMNLTAPNYSDNWIDSIIKIETEPKEVENMDALMKVFDLRAVSLFNDIPSEILLAIADETREVSFNEGDVIFSENDIPDGLYCISTGEVKIIKKDNILATLRSHDFFGELALMDDSNRAASAIAGSDCTLLYLDKNTFDRITDDLPEVLRVVTKGVLKYLRQHMLNGK